MRHLCRIGTNDQTEMPHYFCNSPFINGARVSIGIGKIVVEFGSVDDLERIVGLMDPSITK